MNPDSLRAWQELCELLPSAGLAALAAALEADDPRLIQGASTEPPARLHLARLPVQAADAVAFALWRGRGLRTVAEVDDALGELQLTAGEALFTFLRFWDDTPRELVRRLMLDAIHPCEVTHGSA